MPARNLLPDEPFQDPSDSFCWSIRVAVRSQSRSLCLEVQNKLVRVHAQELDQVGPFGVTQRDYILNEV